MICHFLTSFFLRFRDNINMNQKRNISNESGKTLERVRMFSIRALLFVEVNKFFLQI